MMESVTEIQRYVGIMKDNLRIQWTEHSTNEQVLRGIETIK